MALAHSPKIVTDNLVFFLDAGNTKSYPGTGTAWTDMSGSGNTTTLSGATYNSDNSGNILFDGSNDYATFNPGSDIAFGTGTFAVEVWSRFVGEGPFYFIDTRNSGQTSGPWGIFVNSSELLYWYGGGGSHQFSYPPAWGTGDNGWNQIVFSREGTGSNQFKFYVNGEFIDDATVADDISSISTVASIGCRWNPIEFLDGKISIVRVYKGKGLTAAEVKQNFDAHKGRYGL